jgi:hypothetical protein
MMHLVVDANILVSELLKQRKKSYMNEQVNVDNFFVSLCLGGNI